MTVLPVAAALVLAVVFAAAAVAKLRRPTETEAEFASLGLVAAPTLARVVPGVELATALTLVVAAPWGGVVAFALIAAFTAVLVPVVLSGRVVNCSCFGGISSSPVSPFTLARNGGLAALALVATFG